MAPELDGKPGSRKSGSEKAIMTTDTVEKEAAVQSRSAENSDSRRDVQGFRNDPSQYVCVPCLDLSQQM